MILRDQLYIGGAWVPSSGTSMITQLNATTEEVLGSVPKGTVEDIHRAVAAARSAFDGGEWTSWSLEDRAAAVSRISAGLSELGPELSTLVSQEMGTPAAFSELLHVLAPKMIADYYVNLSSTFAFEETRPGMKGPFTLVHQPVGVVGAIVPWNAPVALSISKLAPALIAGCTVVLKPSPESSLDGMVMADILHQVALPPGVVNVVPAERKEAEELVRHPGVDKIAFTGSTAAGRRVAAICGERLAHCSLELGGKSPAVILDDADLDAVVPSLVFNAFTNNGQACIAQQRVLVSHQRHEELVELLADAVAAQRVGDPLDPSTAIGPLVAERQRDRVERYIDIAQSEGAKLIVGGKRPNMDRGWFVAPTLFAGVHNSMTIATQETFGPVISTIAYRDEEDAIRIANETPYGLAGVIYGGDVDHARSLARRVRAGIVCVNEYGSDFAAPFGGLKQSGLGKEYGPEGLEEYLETTTIRGGD
jgi:aldehyde dehydrogenase (NAD+)